MAESNPAGYQDVNALLRSLTAHLPEHQQLYQQQYENAIPSPSPYETNSVPQSAPYQIDPQWYYWQQHQQQQQQTQPQQHASFPSTFQSLPSSGIQHTEQSQTQNTGQISNQDPRLQAQQQADQHRPSSTQPQSSTPSTAKFIDPKTIVEWPAALRYVTKLTAQHEGVLQQLRRMISNQRENERNWWAGREALQKQQAERVHGKKALDDVFRSIGVQAANPSTTVDDATELRLYDLKVHKAQVKMVDVMSDEMKGLGIPFFGTKAVLINDEIGNPAGDERKAEKDQPKRIGRGELKVLQKKMLSFLEEMCGD